MKTIYFIIVFVMAIFANVASAMTENEVAQYVLDTVPGTSEFDARMCAHVYHHDGTYMVKSYDITLECGKHSLVKDWDLSMRKD